MDRRKKVTLALKKLVNSEKMCYKMAGMSYSERCVLLHREMPEVRIKRTTLSRIYKECKVKNKVIKKVKVIPHKSRNKVEETIIYCKTRISHLRSMGIPIVYADESCLTSKLLPKTQFMIKGKNIEIDEKKLNAKTVAFVVALSEDKGLVNISTYPRSLDQYDFVDFMKKIRKCYGNQRIGLYIDNAGFHIAKTVKKYA